MAKKPPVTATLARLVLLDLSRRMGVQFQHSDRISQVQARTLINAFVHSKSFMEGVKELQKTKIGTDAVKLYHHVLGHFAFHHPADADGGPKPFDRPAFEVTNPRVPFAGMHRDDAEALMAWAHTNADFRKAYLDAKHPEHAALVTQMGELHKVIAGEPATGDGTARESPSSPAPHLDSATVQAEATRLRTELFAMKKTDPRRADLIDQLNLLTQSEPTTVPAPPAAAVQPSPGHRDFAVVKAEIDRQMRTPEYLDGKHAQHRERVEEVSRLYQEAYPEPPQAA